MPIVLEVRLTPSDEVVKLREQVNLLEGRLVALQAEYNHVEYLFRCESIVNQRLTDLCREYGVPLRSIRTSPAGS